MGKRYLNWADLRKFDTNVWVLFGSGLIVRLLIMPWTMHADLLSMYWRANLMVSHGIVRLPTNQFLGHVIYALSLGVMKLVGFNLQELFMVPFGLSPTSMTASVGDWLNFVTLPNINAVLFWLKLPHLIFDVAAFWLLYRMLKESRNMLMALGVWWLNPVNLYAFYVFARHDAVTLFFILGAMVYMNRNEVAKSGLSLFAAVQVRVQPIMLAPFFLIAAWKQKKSITVLTKEMLVLAGLVIIYLGIVSQLPVDKEAFAQVLGRGEETISQTAVSVGVPQRLVRRGFEGRTLAIPILALMYIALGWSYVRAEVKKRDRLLPLNAVLLGATAVYFSVTSFSPHYFVWLSPYVVVAIARNRGYFKWYALAVLGWLAWGVFSGGAFSINQNLFLPLSPLLFGTPQLYQLIPEANTLVVISEGAMRLGLIALAWESLRGLWREEGLSKNWRKVIAIAIIMMSWSLAQRQAVQAALLPLVENGDIEETVAIKDQVIGQTFVAPADRLGAVQLKFDTQREQITAPLKFRIKELGDEEWYFEVERNPADFYNRAYYPFGFPVIEEAKDKIYYFEVEFDDEIDERLSILVNKDQYSEGMMYINGESWNEADLAFRVDADGDYRQMIELIGSELNTKWERQQKFFRGYGLLLGVAVLAWLYPIFQKAQWRQ